MRGSLSFLSKYIYQPNNWRTMAATHIVQPLIAAGNTFLPLALYKTLKDFQEGEFPIASLAMSAGILSSNILLPKLHGFLVDSVRNTVQKDITVDMVGRVYDKELNAVLGSPTGACAVMTSKNYGTVGDVMPTFYGLIIDGMEVVGISYLLTSWYGFPGLIPVLGLGTYLATSLQLEHKTEKLKQYNSGQKIVGFTSLLGAINNYIPAHQFGRTGYELEQLRKQLTTVETSYTSVDRAKHVNAAKLSAVKQIPLLMLVSAIAYKHLHTPDFLFNQEFLLSLYYLMRFSSLMDPLPTKLNTLSTGLVDTQMLKDFIATKSEIPDPVNPLDFKLKAAPKISFRNVTFHYPDSKSGGLSDISLDIKPGQKIVVMGPTGCGKTTLLKLMQRFYNFEGTIEIDGVDITKVRKEDLRSGLAVVSQETGLMAGTLYDNISYGNPRPSDEKKEEKVVLDAARYAGLQFEKARFFTPVKQQGADFSGGERQRINIARFLMRAKINTDQSKVFLMDEPTSALDQKKSTEVAGVLDQLAHLGTTIMITHDPSLAANADQIIYMKAGKISEKGTFNELMQLKGEFYEQMLEQCKKLNISIESIRPNESRAAKEGDFSKWMDSSPSM